MIVVPLRKREKLFFSILFFSLFLSGEKGKQIGQDQKQGESLFLEVRRESERKSSLEGARICGVRPTDDRREQSFNEIQKGKRLGLDFFYHRRINVSASAKPVGNLGTKYSS